MVAEIDIKRIFVFSFFGFMLIMVATIALA